MIEYNTNQIKDEIVKGESQEYIVGHNEDEHREFHKDSNDSLDHSKSFNEDDNDSLNYSDKECIESSTQASVLVSKLNTNKSNMNDDMYSDCDHDKQVENSEVDQFKNGIKDFALCEDYIAVDSNIVNELHEKSYEVHDDADSEIIKCLPNFHKKAVENDVDGVKEYADEVMPTDYNLIETTPINVYVARDRSDDTIVVDCDANDNGIQSEYDDVLMKSVVKQVESDHIVEPVSNKVELDHVWEPVGSKLDRDHVVEHVSNEMKFNERDESMKSATDNESDVKSEIKLGDLGNKINSDHEVFIRRKLSDLRSPKEIKNSHKVDLNSEVSLIERKSNESSWFGVVVFLFLLILMIMFIIFI